jgi:hypothetical protein
VNGLTRFEPSREQCPPRDKSTPRRSDDGVARDASSGAPRRAEIHSSSKRSAGALLQPLPQGLAHDFGTPQAERTRHASELTQGPFIQ